MSAAPAPRTLVSRLRQLHGRASEALPSWLPQRIQDHFAAEDASHDEAFASARSAAIAAHDSLTQQIAEAKTRAGVNEAAALTAERAAAAAYAAARRRRLALQCTAEIELSQLKHDRMLIRDALIGCPSREIAELRGALYEYLTHLRDRLRPDLSAELYDVILARVALAGDITRELEAQSLQESPQLSRTRARIEALKYVELPPPPPAPEPEKPRRWNLWTTAFPMFSGSEE